MLFATLVASLLLAGRSVSAALPPAPTSYLDWKTFKANGVNLGGWLHQEAFIDSEFWTQNGGNTTDEWDLCVRLGSCCGPVLEQRYASYITTGDIDKLAAAGINVLRIPTGYNTWIKVPGTQLYSGNQVRFLRAVSNYAIVKYGMHVIIDVHSLPGGLNGMGLGEKEGNYGWFQNQTALAYSYQVIDAVINYIQSSDYPQAYTLAPINEPVDNRDITKFGTPDALTEAGAAWVLAYFQGVLSRVQKANAKIPVMLQGSFKGEAYWSAKFPTGTNIVFDVHHYYFAGRPTTSANIPGWICLDSKGTPGDGKFPVFVGEWSIQAASNNTLASRATNLNTGLGAFAKYSRGSAYWTYKLSGQAPVNGQGTQSDYWNYAAFIDAGVINPSSGVPCV